VGRIDEEESSSASEAAFFAAFSIAAGGFIEVGANFSFLPYSFRTS
jgi:hypothetical protein